MKQPERRKKLETDLIVFVPPIILISVFCVYVVLDSQRASTMLGSVFDFVINTFGWVFLWYTVILSGLFLFFVFGPYAHRKLGSGKPEFSTITWWGMMFSTNCGAGVLFWATMEGFWNLQSPPFGVQPFSQEAATWALSFQLLHWGPLAWSMYTVFGLAFGYLFYVKNKSVVKPSTACEPLLGSRFVKGWLGKVIDMFYFIGLIGGTATAMSASTPVVSELFSRTFGIERTLTLDALIMITWTVFIAAIVYSGINKGIRLLSDFRIYLSIIVLLLIALFGPSRFIMETFTDSVGNLLQNFFRMTFYLDPHSEPGFTQKWSIFYWAWYLTFLLPTGIYFARISRGRTVREFAVAAVVSSTLGAWLFIGVFSGQMLDVYFNNLVPIAEILDRSGPAAVSVAIWSTLPFGRIMLFLLTVLAYISMATVVNGAVYSMAMVSTKELSGYEEPAGWNRVFWSVAMGVLTVALVSLKQFKPIQTITVITAVPMIVITVMVLVSFLKSIKTEWTPDGDMKHKKLNHMQEG